MCKYIYIYTYIYIYEYMSKALWLMQRFKPTLSGLLIRNLYFASYGSLAYKLNLKTSGGWLVKLSNAFASSDPVPPIISIMRGWSGICGQFGFCCCMFLL